MGAVTAATATSKNERNLMPTSLLPVAGLLALLLACACDEPDPNPEFANLEPVAPTVRQADTLIRVDGPRPLDTLYSPIEFSGEARGFYFFEGRFPVNLETATGSVISRGKATAKAPWMTTEWVPYAGSLPFEVRQPEMAYLVLHRDNPSGEAENAFSYKHPVIIAPATDLADK